MRRKGKNAVTLTGTQQKMRARVGVSIITETGAVAIHEFISSRAVIFIRPVLCINQEPECVEEAVMMPGEPLS
ncbi:hypothetical protein BEH70_25855 [Citrobacter freundii]|jgi:hypothetical protein|nr:hypothetical protein BEH70_25855 [Citrobacter freundii]